MSDIRGSIVYVLIAIAAGAALPAQAGANAILGRAFGGVPLAVLVSLTVSTTLILGWVLAMRGPFPAREVVGELPLQAWFEGLLGAAYLMAVTLAVPRLGAAMTIALVVLGQAVSALTLDHFGMMSLEQRPVTLLHFVGVLLIGVGALAVSWKV